MVGRADVIETIAALGFAFWLLVSALYQTKRFAWVQRLKHRDFFALIPAWSFFAPNPGTTDVHLLYRDKLADGTVTHWKQVQCETTLLRGIWNPHKRLQKGISDMTSDLQRYASRNAKHAERVLIYPSFLALLNFVSQQPHTATAAEAQFTIARSFGQHSQQDVQVQFVSNFHRV